MDDRRAPARHEAEPRPLAPRTLLGLQITAVVILLGWALHATASVSALVAAAVFVAIVLAPLHRRVADATGRRWVAHLVALLVMLVVLLGFAAGLLFAAQRVAAEFPALAQLSGMGSGEEAAGGAAGLDDGAQNLAGGETTEPGTSELRGGGAENIAGIELSGQAIASRIADLAGNVAMTGLRFTTAALGGIVLVVFLALMMLVDAPNWHKRITRILGEGRRDETLEAIAVMGQMVRRFLLVRAAVGALTAALYMLWLWPFGVDLILVWGVLTFLLSFIPNVGSIISGILPTIYAFLTKDLGTAIAVGAGLTVIEQVIGNYVDPRIQGRQISLSPVVILTALLAFAWIWGVPGTLLSTPMLIAAVVIFARFEPLRPVALLLSDCDDYRDLEDMVRA